MYKRYSFLVRLTGLRSIKSVTLYKRVFRVIFSFSNKSICYLGNKQQKR